MYTVNENLKKGEFSLIFEESRRNPWMEFKVRYMGCDHFEVSMWCRSGRLFCDKFDNRVFKKYDMNEVFINDFNNVVNDFIKKFKKTENYKKMISQKPAKPKLKVEGEIKKVDKSSNKNNLKE